ncbi:MAG: DUF192 domain-containing protein [Flavobacteriaceae bacterium]|nr:DUF192 domain-containing protein [Flavobacteriaceae bacterium]
MMSRIKLTVSLVLGAVLLLSSCKQESQKVMQPIKIKFRKDGDLKVYEARTDSVKAQFSIEIADDEYERQRGLMDRKSMENDQGMLFIFPDNTLRSFYMKSTYIPLDIIYIGSDKTIVSFQKNARPLDESSLPSNVPAQYVFEINGGLSDQLDIKVGDSVDYKVN